MDILSTKIRLIKVGHQEFGDVYCVKASYLLSQKCGKHSILESHFIPRTIGSMGICGSAIQSNVT